MGPDVRFGGPDGPLGRTTVDEWASNHRLDLRPEQAEQVAEPVYEGDRKLGLKHQNRQHTRHQHVAKYAVAIFLVDEP